MCVDEWSELFQEAIASSDPQTVHTLLHALPDFQTHEELKSVLLLSMDAEVMLCDLRQKLTDQRAAILSQII